MLKINYDYHGNTRCTPVFIRQDDILKFSYDQFVENIKREVPFIAKLGQVRCTYQDEERLDIDFTPQRFAWQIMDAMRYSRKITINILEGLSPAPDISERKKAKRAEHSLSRTSS